MSISSLLRPIVGDNDFALLVTFSYFEIKYIVLVICLYVSFSFLQYLLRGVLVTCLSVGLSFIKQLPRLCYIGTPKQI